ncbi:hypothetical protein VTL71DRAFT_4491 [Oculimacula yallundae]|uniref:Uncharacterized protein n=1 Tax=Oculimacula yallundae TaxID=86028 RepID=A0ABR4C268_9HELO
MAGFQEFDLTNTFTIRRLAHGIALYLSGNRRSSNNEVIRSFNDAERTEFARIMGQMEVDARFNGLIRELLAVRDQGDKVLILSAEEILNYLEHGQTEQTRRQALSEDEQYALKIQQEENEKAGDRNERVSDDDTQKHPTARMPDFDDDLEVAWDPTTMKRDSAPSWVRKPSYYKIVIPLRKKAVNAFGGHDAAPSMVFNWLEDHDEPSWESSTTLYPLNQWRGQILRKYLGNKQATKGNYLVSERELVLDLIKRQLLDPEKLQDKIKWKRLANEYNSRMRGVIQPKGSQLVQDGAKKNAKTDCDRAAPWRSASALKVIAAKATWKNLVEPILRAARERREQYLEDFELPEDHKSDESRDDMEAPNPGKAPKTQVESAATVQARRDARKAEAVAAKKRKRDMVAEESSSGDDDEEEEDVQLPHKRGRHDGRGPKSIGGPAYKGG